ncbi:MAG: transcriptional regulator NrdR, partial [Microcystis aeruginosa]
QSSEMERTHPSWSPVEEVSVITSS